MFPNVSKCVRTRRAHLLRHAAPLGHHPKFVQMCQNVSERVARTFCGTLHRLATADTTPVLTTSSAYATARWLRSIRALIGLSSDRSRRDGSP
eukprot:1095171-Prorocentrum_minimum.AAC.1